MDFIDKINQLSKQTNLLVDKISTEEATKHSLILPFIQLLGYNIFDPTEVVPEFTAEVGIKKGERVDYAILLEGKPCILIEAKPCNVTLEKHDSQLFRYFATTEAKFAILTNGIIYKFYTDLQKDNKMDLEPFLIFDITQPKENQIPSIRQFHKDKFNTDALYSAALNLQYTTKIISKLEEELASPSKELVKHFLSNIHQGSITQSVLDRYSPVFKEAFNQYISDKINERLNSALNVIKKEDTQKSDVVVDLTSETDNKPKITTTELEIEAYYAVKSIVRTIIDSSRITYKDTQYYFAVLLDDNRNKWICRFFITEQKKRIVFPNVDDNFYFDTIDDIYNYSEKISSAVLALVR